MDYKSLWNSVASTLVTHKHSPKEEYHKRDRKKRRKNLQVLASGRLLDYEGGRLGAWVSFCFRGFLHSGKLWVIRVEDHAAHCRMAREITIIVYWTTYSSLNVDDSWSTHREKQNKGKPKQTGNLPGLHANKSYSILFLQFVDLKYTYPPFHLYSFHSDS